MAESFLTGVKDEEILSPVALRGKAQGEARAKLADTNQSRVNDRLGIEGSFLSGTTNIPKVGAINTKPGDITAGHLKKVIGGQDSLTQGLQTAQSEQGAARAASVAGKVGQEASLRGATEAQASAAQGLAEREQESIRQQEQATLNAQSMVRADNAAMNLADVEQMQTGEASTAYENYLANADMTDPKNQEAALALGKKAHGPDFTLDIDTIVNEQWDAREEEAGTEFGVFISQFKTTDPSFKNSETGEFEYPGVGVNTALDQKMLDLYNAENRTQLDALNEAEHGEWLRRTYNAETQTVSQADKAIAEKDFISHNPTYAKMLEKGQGELALELFRASNLISANNWSTQEMPDGSFVILDESGEVIDDSSFTSVSSGIEDDPETTEREDLLTTKGKGAYTKYGESGSYGYAIKDGVIDTTLNFGGEAVSYKIEDSIISYKAGDEGEWKTISSEGTDTSIYDVGLDIAGKMNPEVEYEEANTKPDDGIETEQGGPIDTSTMTIANATWDSKWQGGKTTPSGASYSLIGTTPEAGGIYSGLRKDAPTITSPEDAVAGTKFIGSDGSEYLILSIDGKNLNLFTTTDEGHGRIKQGQKDQLNLWIA